MILAKKKAKIFAKQMREIKQDFPFKGKLKIKFHSYEFSIIFLKLVWIILDFINKIVQHINFENIFGKKLINFVIWTKNHPTLIVIRIFIFRIRIRKFLVYRDPVWGKAKFQGHKNWPD